MMSWGASVQSCFVDYATFAGRAPRAEYWWWVLTVTVGSTAMSYLGGPWAQVAFTLATLIPYMAVTSRRLHDRGRSGWWQDLPMGLLVAFVVVGIAVGGWAAGVAALAASVWLVVVLMRRGDPEKNEYGAPWKAEA